MTKGGQTSMPSRRQLQREAFVARIVTAAEELLSESERFSDLSVEQVISRAGVSRLTFYSYFDDMGHPHVSSLASIVWHALYAPMPS